MADHCNFVILDAFGKVVPTPPGCASDYFKLLAEVWNGYQSAGGGNVPNWSLLHNGVKVLDGNLFDAARNYMRQYKSAVGAAEAQVKLEHTPDWLK